MHDSGSSEFEYLVVDETTRAGMRRGRQSDLHAYMIFLGAQSPQTQSSPQHRETTTAPMIEEASPPPQSPVDPRIQNQIIQYGILNVFRKPTGTPVERSEEESKALRLNMINLYLKYVIQALLYLLTSYLLYVILSACFQMPALVLIPLVLVAALHLAARRMHQPDHALQDSEGYTVHSISGPFDLMANACILIDKAANYSVGFFSGIAKRLAETKLLDNQITSVPKIG